MIPQLCPFELEIKMADKDEIFRKCRRKTPEWMADFEKLCFSLELEIFKSTTNDGEPAPAVETPSTSEISKQDGNRIAQAFYRQKWVNLSLIAKECFLTDFGPETCPL